MPAAFGGGEIDREELLAAPLRAAPRRDRLAAPLTSLPGIGPKLSAAAARLGLRTLADLIETPPHDYLDRSTPVPLARLREGEPATVDVEVRRATLRRGRRRGASRIEATVADGSGSLKAIWFNRAWAAGELVAGARVRIAGRLRAGELRVEAHELLGPAAASRGAPDPVREAGVKPVGLSTCGLVPVHPAGEGLRVGKVREWVWTALGRARDAGDPLPARLRVARRLPGAADARVAVHFPASLEVAALARRRLAYEELLVHQTALRLRRGARTAALAAAPLGAPEELVAGWLARLPFTPTGDQHAAFAALDRDLARRRPMQRLLMGEVGSGKTVVALYAMLRALESGGQAALMAPTETLAEQHFGTLCRLLGGSGVEPALLSGSTPPARRRGLLAALGSGELRLIVGTHALIEPRVAFADLRVAVVDEQHRFGVEQRRALDAKAPAGLVPHVLHMTATPIPRTLSLTAFGELDVTTLRELPAGRQPVTTRVAGPDQRAQVYEGVRRRLREGRQAFVVCPLVVPAEGDAGRAATTEAERLAGAELAGFEIELLHGQMPAAERTRAMARFASGEAQALVATTVIEVGIDVPNATVMLIEDAERFGLSQLHQLRGRVGRGPHPADCILFAEPRGRRARARLAALTRERDGFALAEADLQQRGQGELLGVLQSGLPRFRCASLPADARLLEQAHDDACALLEGHEGEAAAELGPLLALARERFGDERLEAIPA